MIEMASFGVPIKPGPRRTVVVGTYVIEMENEVESVISLSSPTIRIVSLGSGALRLYSIYNTTGAGAIFGYNTWPLEDLKHIDLKPDKPFRLIEV